MADPLMVALRAIHVLGAVVWAGGTFLLAGFHEYVIDPGDPERTLERMAEYDRMSNMVGMSGILAVGAGLILYWILSDGLAMSWITSPYGATLTVGAVAGLAAVAVAIPFVGLTNSKATSMYADLDPEAELTDEDAETVDRLRTRLKRGERAGAVLLAVAVIAMAVAQYV